MSEWAWILFQLVKPRIGVYSIRLESQTMSEPFQIFFQLQKVGIRCNKLFYMLNNVWITLNIISIGTPPNWMLFNPTGIPDNVRTIPNNFLNPQKWESHSLYVLNNSWMGLNFISIGKTPNQSLFNPTGIPDNVRTIPNNF